MSFLSSSTSTSTTKRVLGWFKFSQIQIQKRRRSHNHHHLLLVRSISAKTLMETDTTTSESAPKTLTPLRLSSSRCVESSIGVEEWQAWGSTSPVPTAVGQIMEDLKSLETDTNSPLSFGGSGGKIQVLCDLYNPNY